MVPEQTLAKLLLIIGMVLMGTGLVRAQKAAPGAGPLFEEIARMDSVLFAAFNQRDVETFSKLFSEDLEFYHDKDGLTGYTQTLESMKRTAAKKTDLNRQLVPGTMEVFPVGNWGAIQIAAHRFCHSENGKQDCAVFRFVHVWKKTTGGWKITRVLSYDH